MATNTSEPSTTSNQPSTSTTSNQPITSEEHSTNNNTLIANDLEIENVDSSITNETHEEISNEKLVQQILPLLTVPGNLEWTRPQLRQFSINSLKSTLLNNGFNNTDQCIQSLKEFNWINTVNDSTATWTGKHRCLIIGFGYAGRYLARQLDKQSSSFHVTVINDSSDFISKPGFPYAYLDESKRNTYRKPMTHYLNNSTIIVDLVTEINNEGDIILKSGRTISRWEYDFLFISTGSDYRIDRMNVEKATIPIIKAVDIDEALQYHSKLEESQTVAIIGSGPTGVEIVGEVAAKYPKKSVIWFAGSKKFMERTGIRGAHESVNRQIKKYKNVEVLLGEHVDKIEGDQVYSKETGKSYQCGFCMASTGFEPKTQFLQGFKNGSILNEKGLIMVEDTLQVKGYPHMFAMGDVTDISEEKIATNAQRQAEMLFKSFVAYIHRGASLQKHKIQNVPMLISVGPGKSLLVVNNKVLMSNWFTHKIKMFVESYVIK